MRDSELLRCPAPAKLNLFLHVLGRRADGYHLLQTAFQLIDWCDYLDFHCREDGWVRRINALEGVPEIDLSVRAAQLLKTHTHCPLGVDIVLDKHLPIGGGLGGGSSDAATTLLALNQLWGLQLTREQLMHLGVQLGADVPFFLFGQNAFAQGIGEQLQKIILPERWFVVVSPEEQISTVEIFSAPTLTRDSEPVRIADFLAHHFEFGRNDLQQVVEKRSKKVADALAWLKKREKNARMSGSGSCVFATFSERHSAEEVVKKAQENGWQSQCVVGINKHPMADFAVENLFSQSL